MSTGIDFAALYNGPKTPATSAPVQTSGSGIDFAALHAASSQPAATPQKESTDVSTAPVTVTPAPASPQADNIHTAEKVAATAVVAAEAIAPGVTASPVSEGAEAQVLNIEESVRRVMSVIPAESALAGFVVPAEVVTHLGFAFFHLFQHHVKTVKSQAK